MTKAEAAELVALVVAQWPQTAVTDKTSMVYEAALLDLDFAVAQVAVSRLAKTARWLPTVAEIREVAADLVHGPKRLGTEAWGDVGDEVRRVGAYGLPRFTDPIVAEAVRVIGWRTICLGDNDVSDRARFIDVYEGLQQRARTDIVANHALPPARGVPLRPELPGAPVALAELVARRTR